MMQDMPIIDAHQHVWQLGRFVYAWLTPKLPSLYVDYLPPDNYQKMRAAGVEGTVYVQADNSLDEAAWLLDLAEHYPFVAGVVGWVDLSAPGFDEKLGELKRRPLFKGVRPPLPLEGDWGSVKAGFDLLAKLNLTCDLLVGNNLSKLLPVMRTCPDTRFIVDHLAGVPARPHGAKAWAELVRPLAELPNMTLKFSGYVSYADPKPVELETVRAYLEQALELFGAGRLIYGSDYPVCRLGGEYGDTVTLLREAMGLLSLSGEEQRLIWGGTAKEVYQL